MKVRRQLAALEPMVLGPLHGLEPEAWHKSSRGKWSIAQIVAHLAQGVDLSSTVLAQRAEKTGMTRRSTPGEAVLRHLLLGFGTFPPGRMSPQTTKPAERPDPEIVAAQYRMGVERFSGLAETWSEKQKLGVFVKHPLLGDLNLPEWVRFHYVHAKHHAKQIRERRKAVEGGKRR